MNLATLIDGHPDDATALISRARITTYGMLRGQVASYRGGLVGLGLVPGDRVAILCANNWYFVSAYLAILGAGMVAVPLNPQSPARELQRELAAVAARAAVVGPSARKAFAEIDRAEIAALEFVIDCGFAGGEDHVDLDDLLAAAPVPVVDRTDDDLAVLMFTSGTAGTPKAAMLSHGNLLSNLASAARPSDGGGVDRASDVVLGVLPLHHIFGLNVALAATLRVGASIVLIERFDPASTIESIERWGVTIVAGPPTLWAALAGLPGVDPSRLATVRIALSGAAALPAQVREAVAARLGLQLREGYGLTESAPSVSSTAGVQNRPGSVGPPNPGVEVRLVDADGEDVEPGDEGEIWVRSSSVFQGYWNDPVATAAALTPDGWLRTGDIAIADGDGYLYLMDRIKDLIIVSGFNVFPGEVEDVLLEHPAVAGAAVVGVAHPHTGEAVKAFVVTRAGLSIEEDDVIDFCRQRLARYKCPSKVQFVDSLPSGTVGKVVRRELRAS